MMAQEDVRRLIGHVARLAKLPIVMGRIDWLKGGIMFVVLISVIIAISLGGGQVITLAGAVVIRH